MTGEARHRIAAWGLTWLSYATYYTGRKGLSVAKKSLELETGVTRDALAFIDTAYLAAYAVGQFANGILGDRIGARRLVGFGMLLSAAACAAFGVSSGALLFGLLFCINGYAQSTGWPGNTRAMAEWTTPDNRGTVMAFWATCYQVGGIAATALAAWLLGRYGWRSVFTVPAACMALVALLVLAFLRPGPRSIDPNRPDGAPTPEQSRAAQMAVLRSRTLWCYGAAYFCIKLIRYSLLFWLPYYLADSLGYAQDDAGYLSTAFEVGGVLGVIGLGILSDRLRRFSRAAIASASLFALAAALFLFGEVSALGWIENALSLSLVGACLFGPDALVSGAAAQDAGGQHGAATATGFVNGMGSIGAILQGWITVEVSEAFGWRALFVSFVALSVAGGLALLPAFVGPGNRGATSS